MSPNIYRIILCLVVLVASLPPQAETLQYNVPPFNSRAWHPEKVESVPVAAIYGWVFHEGAWRMIDPPPYWVPTTYKTVTWEDEFVDEPVAAIMGSRTIPAVMEWRDEAYDALVPETGHHET